MERLTHDAYARPLALRTGARRTSPRASSTSFRREVERERLRPASWSGYRPAGGVEPRSERALASPPATAVRHASLGEGIVTAIEPGGVVTVRFASDGSERRLMVDYAPLEKM